MKFLHLADLHLGKCVLEASMLDDQQHFLEDILEIALQEQVNAIVAAGDLYDRSVPPAEAVEVLDAFLQKANQAGIPVLAVSGNHDSPERLQFLSGILAQQGVHIAGLYDGGLRRVTLEDEHGPVHFYLLPFVKPAFVRHALHQDIADTDAAVRAALEGYPEQMKERNVLVAHQFVCAGGAQPATCESETLSVGGTDQVDVSAFDAFDYVALGHLHQAQAVGRETVRYAGSPLKYSLSETRHRKSVALVTMEAKGQVDIRLIPVLPRRDLRRICGELPDLLAAAREAQEGREDYIWAVLTGDPGLDPAQRLRLLYPNLLHVETVCQEAEMKTEEEESLSPQLSEDELFDTFFRTVNGRSMSPSQQRRVEASLSRLRD